jgi:hypothetical protein
MSVDVVAIDYNPTLWVLECEICDARIGEPTIDGDLIDQRYEKHCALHGLTPENED